MRGNSPIGSTTVQQWLTEINLGVMPSMVLPALPQSRVSLLRWQIDRASSKIHKASSLANEYRLSLLLAPLTTSIWSDGGLVWTGELAAGSFRICPPGSESEWSLDSSCDIVNVFLPHQLIEALCRERSKEFSPLGLKSESRTLNASYAQEQPKSLARSVRLSDTSYRQDYFVLHAIEQLLYAQSRRSQLAVLSCDHLALSLAAYLVAEYSELVPIPQYTRDPLRSTYSRLHNALDYLEKNLSDELTLSELAARSNMSISHFTREFSAVFGQTPHRYILERRLDIVLRRLTETRTAITELAMELGFHDASHLSRAFTKRFGTSPSAFRRAHMSS